jgi:hypothetical protein
MKIEVCPSLDVGRCGIPVVRGIARVRALVARLLRRASASAAVPAADTCRYSNAGIGLKTPHFLRVVARAPYELSVWWLFTVPIKGLQCP